MERFNVIQDICEKLGLTQINNSWIETLGAHLNIPQIPGNDNYEQTVFVEAISNSEVVSSGTYQTATVNITPAEILDMNTTPVELLPTPGVGNVIIVENITCKFDGLTGTIAYNGDGLIVTYGNNPSQTGGDPASIFASVLASQTTINNPITRTYAPYLGDMSANAIGFNDDVIFNLTPMEGISGNNPALLWKNLGIYLNTEAGLTQGDVPLTVYITYRILAI